MNNLTDFYLVGHSFGGFISGHFAIRNSQHIKKLILISPLGLRVTPDDETEKRRFETVYKKCEEVGIKPPSPSFALYMKTAWAHRISPMAVLRTLGKRQAVMLIQN